MSLQQYQRKRRFDRTKEPTGDARSGQSHRAIFVVQLHHASRRHYDFRLQVGGVLRSWAVPKGPSYDPAVKRMAVEVEDHPLDYAEFEGQIPKGQYGGGHVAQFDTGVWSTEGDAEQQLADGHLRFELFGGKLKGGWHLVRSGRPARQPQWLLFKDKDAYAGTLEADDLLGGVATPPTDDVKRAGAGRKTAHKRTAVAAVRRGKRALTSKALRLSGARKRAAPTSAFSPQLAKLGETPPSGAKWLHEIKWDGYRILTTVTAGVVRLWSRNALEWTDRLPEICEAIESLALRSAALDGELIAGAGTKTDFNLLQATLAGEQQGRLSYVLFDLLNLDGVDVTQSPLHERKALLQEVLEGDIGHLSFSTHVVGDGEGAYRLAGEHGFEGIISKRGDRPYQHGRSDEWRKTKQMSSDEFAVVGYTAPKGGRTGFGSLLLARPDATKEWRYAGRVGIGFSDVLLHQISALLAKGGQKRPSVHLDVDDAELRVATWFAPRFVVEVFYRGMGRQQLLRQPSLKTLRLDKSVDDLQDHDRSAAPKQSAQSTKTMKPAAKKKTLVSAQMPVLSSPSKVIFPDINLTKQEVWDYYLAMADWLLPEIAGRPLSVVRCPSGIGNACFFQKHLTAGFEHVSKVKLKEESGVGADYLAVDDLAGLMELVQFNTLEFHPWGSHAQTPERADRVIFDLDPGPGVPFTEVKQAARDIRGLLKQLELESFLRVSGGKGLHIVVPLNPGCDWELTKRFARGFADALAQSQPDRFLATASKRLRNKRIFVDYLRNGRGATAVASYSLRARPGAPVAMPLAWNALGRLRSADAFNLQDVPGKLKRRRSDPWKGIDTIKQDLSRWSQDE